MISKIKKREKRRWQQKTKGYEKTAATSTSNKERKNGSDAYKRRRKKEGKSKKLEKRLVGE